MIYEDPTLIQLAQMKKTGANVHKVASAIALYRNEIELANMKNDASKARLDKIAEYEKQLRILIA
jgi:uncharacterized protein YlzI (FlbEa/FlbD family)